MSLPVQFLFLLSPHFRIYLVVVCVCESGRAHAMTCVWRSEDKSQDSVWRLEEKFWELLLAFRLAVAWSFFLFVLSCSRLPDSSVSTPT